MHKKSFLKGGEQAKEKAFYGFGALRKFLLREMINLP
jgi:hypothetical protein